MDIVFAAEGGERRAKLLRNILHLRSACQRVGLDVAGTPSPIVPVFVGRESVARLTSRAMEQRGLLANLVEFPAVARGMARFRLQVMADHELEHADQAARIMAESKQQAMAEVPAT